jgi:putative ABC transport system permease protein
MQHWLQLATRSWRTRPARSGLAVLSIMLGVGVVVWVTCCYESVRHAVTEVALQWIGRSHISIEPAVGVWGDFDADVADRVARLDGVLHVTSSTRHYVQAAPAAVPGAPPPADSDYDRIEITGVVPETEPLFHTNTLTQGRFILPSDSDAIVVEGLLARQFKLAIGDEILIRHHTPPNPPRAMRVVGIMDRRRASVNQAMMTWARLDTVQSITRTAGRVKSVDIILSDPSVANIQTVADTLRAMLEENSGNAREASGDPTTLEVKTTEAQHKRLGAAQSLLQFIMLLLSCVVLLTAFFIIIATMSMGVMERISELGMLRCVGVTRRQLAGLVALQTIPLGVVGTLLGLPLGLALQWLTIQAASDYLGQFSYNTWGMALAVCGGIGTTALGAAVPAIRAFGVSPAEAVRAAGDTSVARWAWGVAGGGLVLLAAHEVVNRTMTAEYSALFDIRAILSVVLLYLGAALLVPLVVIVVGRGAVFVAAWLLRLSPQLLGDEIHKAPFRSAAICCGLMVGLSLIVGLVVWGESVKEGWQFPKEFPDALLYTYVNKPLDEMQALRDTPDIKDFTVTDDFAFSMTPPSRFEIVRKLSVLDQFSRMLAIDPDEGFNIVKFTFLEGNRHDALALLKQGGHILTTREFSRKHGMGLGDRVTIWVGKKKATFTVAGVIASPGLDIAISFFNATTYYQTYAVGAIIGTLDDADRLFDRKIGRLLVFNFAFEADDETRIYSESTQTVGGATKVDARGRPTFALSSGPIPGDGPEERIVNSMLERIDFPPKAFVTARELKQHIDRSITRVTLLLSAIPLVGLLIAAIGLGNLMAANVASRAREMAILRAIGVTKNQMLRVVIGEAVVLALIGSATGLVLGLGLARTSNLMTERLTGFSPDFAVPWPLIGACAALATLLCVLAAMIPARYASRSNIVAALSDA